MTATVTATATDRDVLSAVVIDDTPDFRLLLTLALQRDGDIAVVAEAENGLEGVEVVAATQPDLVLIDLAMPVMDGLEALPLIRRVCPSARVVVLSGFEAGAMAQRAAEAGAEGYLQKGASPASILAFVRELVGRATVPEVAPAAPVVTRAPAGELPSPRAVDPAGTAVGRSAEHAAVGLVLLTAATTGRPVVGYGNARAVDLLRLPREPVGRDATLVAPALVAAVGRSLAELVDGREARDVVVTTRGRLELTLVPLGVDVLACVAPVREGPEATRLRQAIGAAAHEIRNPVTVVLGIAGLLRDRGAGLPEEQRGHMLEALLRQSRLLDRVTGDLLTAAQAHRGSLHVAAESVDLTPVLDGIAEDRPDVSVTVTGAAGVRVLADPTRLTQMVSNLVSNAVKYGAPPIDVSVRRTADPGRPMVAISVADAGPGVPEEFRSQLFEEFSRAGDSRAPGTGLGLFVVRSLAEAQGGWADYAPGASGGSVFTITLPDAQRRRPVPPPSAP